MNQNNQALDLSWNSLSAKLRLDISREFFMHQREWQPVQKDESSLRLLGQIAAHEFYTMHTDTTSPDTWYKSWGSAWRSLKNDEQEYVAAAFMENLVNPNGSLNGETLSSEGFTFSDNTIFNSKDALFKNVLIKILVDISLLNDPWCHWEDVSNPCLGRLTSIIFGMLPADKQNSLANRHSGLGAAYAGVLSGSSATGIGDPSEYKWAEVGKLMSSFCDELSDKKEVKLWYSQTLPIMDKLFMYHTNLADEKISSWEPWWHTRGLIGWSAASARQISSSSSCLYDKSDISNKILKIPLSVFDRALDLLPQKPGFLKKLNSIPPLGLSKFIKNDTNVTTQSWMMMAACRDHPEAFMSFEGLDVPIFSVYPRRQFWDGLRNGDIIPAAVVPFFYAAPKVQLAVAKDNHLSETLAQWFESHCGDFSTLRHMAKNENGRSYHDKFLSAWGTFREARLLSQIDISPRVNQGLKI